MRRLEESTNRNVKLQSELREVRRKHEALKQRHEEEELVASAERCASLPPSFVTYNHVTSSACHPILCYFHVKRKRNINQYLPVRVRMFLHECIALVNLPSYTVYVVN